MATVFNKDYLVTVFGDASSTIPIQTLPYLAVIRAKLPDIAIKLTPFDIAPDKVSQCFGILQEKLRNPCLLELIWSYWHEEGMLVQTINAITRRFQNVRGPARPTRWPTWRSIPCARSTTCCGATSRTSSTG